jgi:hypothetical protein
MRPRVQRASGIPCALFIFEGEDYLQNSGVKRREIAATYPVVIARLDRAIQYSSDVNDRTEKPRRTGSPASAGDDSFVSRRAIHVIASGAKQSMHPRSTYGLLRRKGSSQ